MLVLEPTDAGHDATLYFKPRAPRDSSEFYADARYGEMWVGRRPSLDELAALTGVRTVPIEELADHLFKTHGIKTSRSAMQRFCAKIDVRPYRPTYRFLRADAAKQAAAKEDLAGLKKSAGGRAGAAEPG